MCICTHVCLCWVMPLFQLKIMWLKLNIYFKEQLLPGFSPNKMHTNIIFLSCVNALVLPSSQYSRMRFIFMLTIILSEAVKYQVGGNLILEQTNFTNSSAADCYFSAHAAHSQIEESCFRERSTRCLLIHDLCSSHISEVAGNRIRWIKRIYLIL